MFRFDIITLFPSLCSPYLEESILKLAIQNKLIEVEFWNPRDFSTDKHSSVDDIPYGGGPGMILTPQPMYDCIQAVKKENKGPVIFLSPGGTMLTQSRVEKFAKLPTQSMILICGRYEGLDQRVIDLCIDMELSIGKYVLAGGELPALVVLESISRLIPGVLGNKESFSTDSFSSKFKRKRKYPLYTRPKVFEGLEVPDVLSSGNHEKIEEWRNNNLR